MATVEEILDNVRACFCAILADTAGGSPASCCVTVGPPVIAECCKGFAWVRLVSAWPTSAFPSHANAPTNCMLDSWALAIEIGVTRCAPQPCDVLGNVCCTAQDAASAILLDDFKAMRKLFSCGCTGIPSKQIVVGNWTTYGPEGGCVGSKMNATILTSGNCDCMIEVTP